MAVDMLARSLANEIEPDGNLLFRGPPATRFTVTPAEPIQNRDLSAISRAAKWVYESPREVENRHILLSMEVARAALKGGNTHQLAAIAGAALEGAKIAYNFGINQQSRDTLKALSDLRKSVSDETSKLSETTRGLATAIAGAVFANIGIMVARLSISPNNIWVPWAAVSLGVVLAIYVATMIASGAHFLWLQQTLRKEWRARLYRFLDDAEYQRMVTDPVRRAERAFWHASIAGGIMAVMLLVAVVIIAIWQP